MRDWEQLADYIERADESAFAEIVRRHLDLIYSAAVRQTSNPTAAEEITQSVFVLLAEKAHTLRPTGSLAAWLYGAARLKGLEYLRMESKRRAREQKIVEMNASQLEDEDESPINWEQLSPLLENAMGELGETDRAAVLMRYFQNAPYREVGDTLGLSEDAARKRVSARSNA